MTLDQSRQSASILVLTHAAELGGAELALLRLLDELDSTSRSRVRVATLADGRLAEELRQRGIPVEVVALPSNTLALKRSDLLKPTNLTRAVADTAPLISRLVQLGRRHHIIQTASMKAHVLGIPISWLSRKPLVWYLHDRLGTEYLPPVVLKLLRLASRVPRAVIVNSLATADTVPRRSTVIYPGFAPNQALTAAEVLERRPPQPAVFVLLGRVSPTKGQEEFVRAAAHVLKTHPATRFRVVGSPMFGEAAYDAHVRDVAAELGVPVEWVGFSDDPLGEIDGATALVHASPVPEPFGQVVLEACVRGVPVIATEAGGVPEILGGNGLLVTPGDVEALTQAMQRVLEDPAGTKERAVRAHARALEEFPLRISAERLETVWQSIAGPQDPDPVRRTRPN